MLEVERRPDIEDGDLLRRAEAQRLERYEQERAAEEWPSRTTAQPSGPRLVEKGDEVT